MIPTNPPKNQKKFPNPDKRLKDNLWCITHFMSGLFYHYGPTMIMKTPLQVKPLSFSIYQFRIDAEDIYIETRSYIYVFSSTIGIVKTSI